ncbi:MAG TPA: hypothetical protein VMU59_02925 [Caulobacteraceae bacterium]|nr:hypothetical protein [Caulobacteraceae bacterium]
MSALAPACAFGLAFISLGGCVDPTRLVFQPPPVALTSPLAKDIAAASAATGAYPKFVDVPATPPADIRPGSAWSNNTYDTLNLRRQQRALAALYPQTLFDTEGFAKANREKAVPPPAPPAPAAQGEDYAKAQRNRAIPPSPSQ